MEDDRLTGRLTYVLSQARRPWKLTVLVLLFMLLSAAAVGVAVTLNGPDWGSFWQSLLFGLLLSWTLAVLRKSAWVAVTTILIIGLVYILLFPGELIGQLIAIFGELVRLGVHIFMHTIDANADFTTLARLVRALTMTIVVVWERVSAWMASLATGQPVFDPVATTLVWNALVWAVATWAGWSVEVRQNALLAILPAILLSVGVLAYAGRMSFTLYLMLGSTLLILATVQQERRQETWDKMGMSYPREKGRQIVNIALFTTLVLVLVSAGISSISAQQIREWISEQRNAVSQQNDNLAQSLGIESGVGTAIPSAFGLLQSPGLPRERLIGSSPVLSKQVVMTISIGDSSSVPLGGQLFPVYWRSSTYDVYTGHGWATSQTEQASYQPDQSLQSEHTADQVVLRQSVYPVEDLGGTLYATGEPLSVNVPVDAAWRSPGDLFGVKMDHSTSYSVVSTVPVPAERALRAAGQEYPDWIRRRFSSLPAEVPDRVTALAIRLTASKATPYDRALAIEEYLRMYPYTLDVVPPPPDRDLVDYFLFDLKKGYCDYYASAMVVLARAAGVPARLAVGYASGTYNLNSKRFVVTEADAHSWVEVYFPGIGWVPFEPTAARPILGRTTIPVPTTTSQNPNQSPGTPETGRSGFPTLETGLLAGIIFISMFAAMWGIVENARLRRLPPERSAAEVYRSLRRLGDRLSVVSAGGDTPYEFARSLTKRLQEITMQGDDPSFGLRVIRDVDKIVDGIVNINYRPLPPRSVYVLSRWRVLRWQLRLIWILKSWNLIIAHFKTTIG